MTANRYLLWSLLALPVVELVLLVRFAVAFGFIPVMVWLLIAGTLGFRILQTRSWVIVNRVQEAIRTGESVGGELLDNALVVVGAVLLIVPGFLSDGIALLCLLPPTRALIARYAVTWLTGPRRSGEPDTHTLEGEFRRED